jgi:uncharacterized protein (DUF362 family)
MFLNSDTRFSRRYFLKLLAAVGGGVMTGGAVKRWHTLNEQPVSRVMVLKAETYTQDLTALIRRGLQSYPRVLEQVKGGRVLLKPNLVEYYKHRRVNTHPAMVVAAVEAFRAYGAAEVIVAEGPGHRRDMELLLVLSGLEEALRAVNAPFVNLNLDAMVSTPLRANYTGLGRLFFPETVLDADLVVSMPKLKTHHLAGITLSLKNMFGVVPGAKYGWPKNLLHWQGIHNSIVDINATIRPGFTIVDGIEGMEGDGPLNGETVASGVVLLGDSLPAVDATGARLMGIYPEHIPYLLQIRHHGGTLSASRIRQIGEPIAAVQQNFKVLPQLRFLKEPPSLLRRLFLVGQ